MNLFSLNHWSRALRDPVTASGLIIDLFPIFAVLNWGWDAAPLVLLYWLENLIIGVVTLARMVWAGVSGGGLTGLLGVAFFGAFFIVHYGMFCAVHGLFLFSFLADSGGVSSAPMSPFDLGFMVGEAIESAQGMRIILALIIGWQAYRLFEEFHKDDSYKDMALQKVMFAPYGRIVVLHIGIFAGAFGVIALGEPMIGILAIILLRAIWGLIANTLKIG